MPVFETTYYELSLDANYSWVLLTAVCVCLECVLVGFLLVGKVRG